MKLSATVKKFGKFETIDRQIRFGCAVALTKTAKQAQEAVLKKLDDNFELRTNWAQPSNKIGLRITPAKKDELTAEIKTLAAFLKKFDTGEDKIPLGKYIAIPTANVKRTKRQVIAKSNRPRNLKRAFIIKSKKNNIPILFQRTGKGKKSDIRAMYVLVPKAEIDQLPTFREPVERAVKENFARNFDEAVKDAFATAR